MRECLTCDIEEQWFGAICSQGIPCHTEVFSSVCVSEVRQEELRPETVWNAATFHVYKQGKTRKNTQTPAHHH